MAFGRRRRRPEVGPAEPPQAGPARETGRSGVADAAGRTGAATVDAVEPTGAEHAGTPHAAGAEDAPARHRAPGAPDTGAVSVVADDHARSHRSTAFDDVEERPARSEHPGPTFSAWVGGEVEPVPEGTDAGIRPLSVVSPVLPGPGGRRMPEEGARRSAEGEVVRRPRPPTSVIPIVVDPAAPPGRPEDRVVVAPRGTETTDHPRASESAGIDPVVSEARTRETTAVEPLADDSLRLGSGDALTTGSIPLIVVEDSSTGQHAVVRSGYDLDLRDDADDLVETGAIPLASPRVSADEDVLQLPAPTRVPPSRFERSDDDRIEDLRVGAAFRQFWLWVPATALAPVLVVAVGLAGLSLGQAAIAIVAGAVLALVPLGVGAAAGARSGQPLTVVARAVFGMRGSWLSSVLVIAFRCSWTAILAVVALEVVSEMVAGPDLRLARVILAAGAVLAIIVAVLGFHLLLRVQGALAVLATVMTAVVIAVTAPSIDLEAVLARPAAPWPDVLGGAVLVFATGALAWANASGDLARYQRPGTSVAGAGLWASAGVALPVIVLFGYSFLLWPTVSGRGSTILGAFRAGDLPLGRLASAVDASWWPWFVIATLVLGLLSAATLSTYSAGLAVRSLVPLPRAAATLVAVMASAGLFVAAEVQSEPVAVILLLAGVGVAAWTGLLSADLLLRRRSYDTRSLLERGGAYGDWRPGNLLVLVLATVAGAAFAVIGPFLGSVGVLPGGGPITATLGVLLALGIGLAGGAVVGRPGIRRQERSGARRETDPAPR